MTVYVIHPDKTIKEFDHWPWNNKDIPKGVYIYDPTSMIPWVVVTNDYASVDVATQPSLPAYCRALQLIVPPNT